MDSQPPNDPNNNRHTNFSKEVPFDGNGRQNNGRQNNGGNEPMDIMGDMRDSPAVVVMFLVGVASWFLRERCIC
eukprot:CAMPEP_0117008638 /NCGR_PEP_ID=MMETSP0472-20121206/8078_1 /TAXON_ID=693140 ORGANISM="Tiarina fusus, Strain LIS" /NCGR_SAMPLE_ID=MMETSP0472 /ASSEMBLY_ACC=CAM_ASM_000603 /LENGTH=73 /DNA_ID=CAMNT_0004710727 /DNA_START=99 /DNA_END=320 /DNA_ORIENTATION=+